MMILEQLIILLLFGGTAALLYYFIVILPRRVRQAFAHFALKHDFSYYPSGGKIIYTGILPGRFSNLVVGRVTDIDSMFAMFHYLHVTGSGKSRREYRRTVAAVGIKETKLHTFLNSKLNELTEQVELAKSQRYDAEGSFGKYFDIYSPEGKQITALSIFAPDVLSLIMAHYGFYDIEIVDDVLYVYDYKFLETSDDLERFYQQAIKLAKAVNDNAPSSLKLHLSLGEPDPSAVTALKKSNRLFTEIMIVSVVMAASLAAVANFSFITIQNAWIGSLIMPTLFVGIVVYVIIYSIMNNKLKDDYLRDRAEFQKDHVPKAKRLR